MISLCNHCNSSEPGPTSVLLESFARIEAVKFKPGQILFYQGHFPHGMYLLKNGCIKFEYGANESRIQVVEHANIHPLGLAHLLSNTPNCCTAKAHDTVVTAFIPKKTILQSLNALHQKHQG